MTQFTKSFIWKFIWRLFIVQLFVSAFLGWIVSGVQEETFWMVPFFVPYAVSVAVIDAFIVFLIAGICFEKISYSYCYEYPKDPDKWFRNFVLIICAEKAVMAVITFIHGMIDIGRFGRQQDPLLQETIDYIYNDIGITIEPQQPLWEVISHLELRMIACYVIQIVAWAIMMCLLLNSLKRKYNECLYKGPEKERQK